MAAQAYVASVTQALNDALCLQPFPSPKMERCSVPQVEWRCSPELVCEPVLITRGESSTRDACLIESSINSCRVSLRLPTGDPLEAELLSSYMRFIMQRAETLQCLRKVPVKGYHITFLITDTHLVTLGKAAIIHLIVNLIQQSESEVTSLKLSVNARGRAVATQFLRSLAF